MKIFYLILVFSLINQLSFSQPNCNAFLWQGDTAQFTACKLLEDNLNKHYQFSREFHEWVDSAITICPRFAYAYREKAAPYVKSGNFLEWKKYIDLAVKYDSLGYLPVRASLRYKFFADYKGAIEDIELLEKIYSGDIGSSSNGTYHLKVVKALCYKKSGNLPKAIQILEAYINEENYSSGPYDLLHLGVMYLEAEDYKNAEKYLDLQNVKYEFADTYYYLALLYKKTGDNDHFSLCKNKAHDLYSINQRMNDTYNHLIDQIYHQQILKF